MTCVHIHSAVHCFAVMWQMVTMAKNDAKIAILHLLVQKTMLNLKVKFFDLSTYVIAACCR